jgi:hypothetical protein
MGGVVVLCLIFVFFLIRRRRRRRSNSGESSDSTPTASNGNIPEMRNFIPMVSGDNIPRISKKGMKFPHRGASVR